MPKTDSLVKKLAPHYPNLSFEVSDEFRWSSETSTVFFCTGSNDTSSLLHEVAHGILEHSEYDQDIQLIQLERDAWTYAKRELAPLFKLTIDDEFIEETLDSYRDWLHARSLCPNCQQTGIQSGDDTYLCLGCDVSWHVNEARRCGLKRTKIHTKTPAL